MTTEEAVVWKRELVNSFRGPVERFNADCQERYPDHVIDPIDAVRSVLGLIIVKTRHPSCDLRLEIETGRHPVLHVSRVCHRVANLERRTQEQYPIISRAGEPLLVDDITESLTSDQLAERLMQFFQLPAE